MSDWEQFVDELVHKLNKRCKIKYHDISNIEKCEWCPGVFSQGDNKLLADDKYCHIEYKEKYGISDYQKR